jgi:hypothetical protein
VPPASSPLELLEFLTSPAGRAAANATAITSNATRSLGPRLPRIQEMETSIPLISLGKIVAEFADATPANESGGQRLQPRHRRAGGRAARAGEPYRILAVDDNLWVSLSDTREMVRVSVP